MAGHFDKAELALKKIEDQIEHGREMKKEHGQGMCVCIQVQVYVI